MGTRVSEKWVAPVVTIEVVVLVVLGLLASLWPADSSWTVMFVIWMFNGGVLEDIVNALERRLDALKCKLDEMEKKVGQVEVGM